MIDFRIGKYGCLTSTNQVLRTLINEGKQREGVVIQAEEQTAGKGCGENIWESEAGKNLLFSFYLKPDFLTAAQQFYLSMSLSLTIINVLKEISGKSGFAIKWPNDIYFERKKIAGFLIENSVQGSHLSESILGVGLNINQEVFSERLPNPISLIQITEMEWEKDKILDLLFQTLNKFYDNLKQGMFQQIEKQYLEALFLRNVSAKYRIENQIIEGKLIGIDEFGRLQLNTENGLNIYGFKEIEFVL